MYHVKTEDGLFFTRIFFLDLLSVGLSTVTLLSCFVNRGALISFLKVIKK